MSATRVIKFLNLISNSSASQVAVLFIILQLLMMLLGESLLVLNSLLLDLRCMQYLVVCIQAADSSYTIDSNLLDFILGVLAYNSILRLRPDCLTRDDSDLVASVSNRISFSYSVHITGGLTSSLPSGLGRSTRQLLPNDITDLDGGRRVHNLFDVGRDGGARIDVVRSLLALAHIDILSVRLGNDVATCSWT